MRKGFLKGSFFVGLVLVLGVLFISCNKNRDEDSSIYVVKLQVKHFENDAGKTLDGTISYKDSSGKKAQMDLYTSIDESISFEVTRNYQTLLEIDAVNLTGIIDINWTITNKSTGVVVQKYVNRRPENGKNYKDVYQDSIR